MKTALLTAALLISSSAFASMTRLEKGDTGLYNAPAEIVSVRPICPVSEDGFGCLAIGSKVKLKVRLGGCLDRLAGHMFNLSVDGDKGVLHFGAVAVSNEMSTRAFCVAMPTALVEIYVPFEGELELASMSFRPAVR